MWNTCMLRLFQKTKIFKNLKVCASVNKVFLNISAKKEWRILERTFISIVHKAILKWHLQLSLLS